MVMPKSGGQEQTPQELLVALLKSMGLPAPPTKEDRKNLAAAKWFTEAKSLEADAAARKDCECLACVTQIREYRMAVMICRAAAHAVLGKPEGFNLLVERFDEAQARHPDCFAKPAEPPP